MVRLLIVGLVALFLLHRNAGAAPKNQSCTDEAERKLDQLTDWHKLYVSFQRNRHCDDGGLAEGYSDVVVKQLINNWSATPQLLDISKSHPEFERFVFHHVDDLMSLDDKKAIARNADTKCPTGASHFCSALKKKLATLDLKY